MKLPVLTILVCAVGLLSSSSLFAQKKEFEHSYNENFLKRSSFLNKESPDVEVHDERGNSFRLAQSRGKYTVVVFGCLT